MPVSQELRTTRGPTTKPRSSSCGSWATNRSCVYAASRSRKAGAGDEWVDLGKDRGHRFHIEALPIPTSRRRSGCSTVLDFFFHNRLLPHP